MKFKLFESLKKKYTNRNLQSTQEIRVFIEQFIVAYKTLKMKGLLFDRLLDNYYKGNISEAPINEINLWEIQFRVRSGFCKMSEEDKTASFYELQNNIWIPVISSEDSFKYGVSCIDLITPSIKISKMRIDSIVDMLRVIACPVNEFVDDKNFNLSQIIIVEQDINLAEAITYKRDDQEIVINGKILFAISKTNQEASRLLSEAADTNTNI